MIRHAGSPAPEKQLTRLLAGEDLLHACLLSTYRNARAPGADFWVCEGERGTYGALLRIDGEFIFCSGETPDFAELIEFLHFMDCRCLCARLPVLEKLAAPLGLGPPEHAPAMLFKKGSSSLSLLSGGQEKIVIRREREGLRPIYALISGHYESFDNYGGPPGYDGWLSGMRLRERDGVCGIWALYADGQLAATASVMSASCRCADIGAVVTRRECRRRGYAARLIRFLCGELEAGGRTPILCCAEDGLAGYYQRLGFVTFDHWAAAGQAENTKQVKTEDGNGN